MTDTAGTRAEKRDQERKAILKAAFGLIGLVVLAIFVYAFLNRHRPGIAGPGGALRAA